MPTVRVDPATPDAAAIAEAARVLRAGGLVAFPTETVYGLGANALDEAAVRRIFAAKGRPSFNPLIAHVADAEAARAIVPDVVTAGLPAVAVRMPAHPVAHALLVAAGVPVAAPSANRFTELSPTLARHVEKALGDRVELILDGGPTAVGIESTVVDLTGARPTLLRPGTLSPAAIAAVLGAPLAEPEAPASPDAPRLAPGMVERHYAPHAALWLFDAGEAPEMAARIATAREEAARGGSAAPQVAALLLGDWLAAPSPDEVIRMPAAPDGYARRLYAVLHALDDAGTAVVLVERPPADAAWAGVRDRLERAAR